MKKILNSNQKFFLVIWIPILLIVAGAVFGNVGREIEYKQVEYVFSFNDFLETMVFLFLATVYLVWIIGASFPEQTVRKTGLYKL